MSPQNCYGKITSSSGNDSLKSEFWDEEAMKKMVETLEVRDMTVVRLVGDSLDASNAGSFRAVMSPLLDEDRDIVLQMSDVRFFDSSGLGALLHCLKRLHNTQRSLSLIGVNKS